MKTLSIVAAFFLGTAAAQAAPVTYSFEAEFFVRTGDVATSSVADAAEALGNLSGTFTFDDQKIGDETGDTGASPNFTRSLFSVTDLSFDVLDITGVELPDLFRIEENDANDNFGLVHSTEPPDVSWERVSFLFLDSSRTVFDSTDLPQDFDLSDFSTSQLFFVGENADGGFERTTFTITSLTQVAPIPLPAGAWLMLTALLGLAGLRRRGSA